MEIVTSNNSRLMADSDDANDVMDMVVNALIVEGYHPDTIHEALIEKAEAMVTEFNIKEGDKDD